MLEIVIGIQYPQKLGAYMPQSRSPASQLLMQDAVTAFSRETRFPLAFGGFESDGIINVSALSGMHGLRIQGLRVANRRGLGGKAMSEHRPRFTRDYMSSTTISHDYDAEIGSEHIVMLVAVPVVVDGVTRAVLYGGTRGGTPPDESFMRAAAGVTADLAHEIALADAAAATQDRTARGELPGTVLEELRSSHAELRRIAADTTDPVARARLSALDERLVQLSNPTPAEQEIHLTEREFDVLSHAAIGATNAEIATALGIAGSTVKSYLKTAMGKLQASTRHAAVATARGHGLIP